MALHCSECGFVNPEGANYCLKCGAYLAHPEGEDASTMAYKVGETGEYEPVDVEEEVDKAGAALVVRSGGGRAGESFTVDRVSFPRRQVDVRAVADQIGDVLRAHVQAAVEATGHPLPGRPDQKDPDE